MLEPRWNRFWFGKERSTFVGGTEARDVWFLPAGAGSPISSLHGYDRLWIFHADGGDLILPQHVFTFPKGKDQMRHLANIMVGKGGMRISGMTMREYMELRLYLRTFAPWLQDIKIPVPTKDN